MGSSNMIELRDLVSRPRRVYAPTRFLSPAQIAAASRAPRLRLSPNGAFVNQRADVSNNHYTGILGGSLMSDLAGDIGTYNRSLGLSIDEAYQNQQQALAMAAQAQAQRDAYAAKLKQAQQQVTDMQAQVAASQVAQQAQQAAATQAMLAQQAQLDTSTRMLAYKQQKKLDDQVKQFAANAADQVAAQSVRNRGLDAAMWQQRQQDNTLATAQAMAAIQAAAGAPSSPMSLTPAQPMLMSQPHMPMSMPSPSQNLPPEGGNPVVDFGATAGPQASFNPNPDAAGFAPNWDSNTGGQLIPDQGSAVASDEGSYDAGYGDDMSGLSFRNYKNLFTPKRVAIGAATALLLYWALKQS